MHLNAKCNHINLDWEVCNIEFSEHSNLDHKFEPRVKYKEHIVYSDSKLYCGWSWYVGYKTINPHMTAIKNSVKRNSICRSCLKNFLYLEQRNRFFR